VPTADELRRARRAYCAPLAILEFEVKFRNRILACLLASLTALAGLVSSVASAQTGDAPTVVKGNLATFVVYRNASGEIACRVATAEERRRIMEARDGDGLHLIYRGAPRTRTPMGVVDTYSTGNDYSTGDGTSSTSAATSSGSLPALLPSAGLHIYLHGTEQLEQNQAAKNAFIVAANRWEALISNPINVVIDVDYGPKWFGQDYPNADIIGQTSSRQNSTSFSNLRQRLIANSPTSTELNLYNALPASNVPVEGGTTSSSVVVTRANARALGLSANITNPDSVALGNGDARIGFNSAFGFDFNPDDGISSGLTDFDAVVTHEIGHALGFVSESGGDDPSTLSIWDVFRFRPGAASLGSMATAPRVMAKGGTQVFFDAQPHLISNTNTQTQELGLSTGGPDPGPNDGDRNQSGHWKDDAQVAGRPYIGIMDPTIGSGVRRVITDNDTNALDAFGYAIGGSVGPPPPPPPGPSNDNFVNAIALQTVAGGIMGTNQNATAEAGEPVHSFPSGQLPSSASVWYNWTSPTTGTATFDTVSSNYDTTLAAYTGPAVNQLSLITENDDVDTDGGVYGSRITFNTTAGTTYRIQVDGYDGDTGSIVLNWTSTGTAPTPTPTPTPVPTPTPALVTGRVLVGTQPLQGVAVGIFQQPSGTLLRQTFTGNDGRWNLAGSDIVVGQNYSVTLYKAGYNLTTTNLGFAVTQPTHDTGDIQATKGNDIDETTFFVTQHYRDFLGREPDASGLGFWTGQIESCGISVGCREAKRINVSAAFFLSIEFQETGYLVERMYKTAYGDTTEGSTGLVIPIIRRQEFLDDTPLIRGTVVVGQGDWQGQLEANKTAYAQAFVQRQRFTDAFPSALTPTQFVAKLNQNAGGVLTQVQVDSIAAEMSANAANGSASSARSVALRRVAERAELDRIEKSRAFVLMQYYGYLRRNPNDAPENNLNFAGWNFWLTKLLQANGDAVRAEMVKAFIASTEYRQRFGN
jgi:hypothetical protein